MPVHTVHAENGPPVYRTRPDTTRKQRRTHLALLQRRQSAFVTAADTHLRETHQPAAMWRTGLFT